MDDSKAIAIILASKLLDIDRYRTEYSIDATKEIDLIENYFYYGVSQEYNPNPYFNTHWYLEKNPDIESANINPLLHYILYGEKEGRWPCPYFDPVWYKKKYKLRFWNKTALLHYLIKGRNKKYSPLSLIDVEYYLQQNADVNDSGTDPVQHFIEVGCEEGRLPRSELANPQKVQEYLRANTHAPFIGKLKACLEKNGNKEDHPLNIVSSPTIGTNLATEIRKNLTAGPDFEEFDSNIAQQNTPNTKVIAFYLPQFYSFPENDKWWGKGFTEWTNVAKGTPRFKGHYQPRTPRDLGYYNLTSKAAIRSQIKLAEEAGLYGFCHYYYWFNQKRMLDKPLDKFVDMEDNEFPFCLMWANENWTRTWDGLENDVLMHQDYRDEDEDALLKDLYHYFSQSNYIKVDDKPVFIIYRPSLIPNSKETFIRWRKKWKETYQVEPHMLMVQGFNDNDPTVHGLDGAVEFPPHKLSQNVTHIPHEQLEILDPEFTGAVAPYDAMITRSLSEDAPEYPLIKSVTPSWDNDARREGRGYTLTGSTPKKYQKWLKGVIDYSQKNPFHDESFVFINAWNEWAEGAYLEPDIHYGAAYLNATARAINNTEEVLADKMKILLVGHDAHPHGAQMVLLNIAKILKQQFGLEVTVLLLESGPLLKEYQEITKVSVVSATDTTQMEKEIRSLKSQGFELAITNTTVTGIITPALKKQSFKVISLIHELPQIIKDMNLTDSAKKISKYADKVIFPSTVVNNGFRQVVKKCKGEEVIRPQGVYNPIQFEQEKRDNIRQQLGLSANDKLVINAGYADLRKGFDIFINTAQYFEKKDPSIHFLWLGNIALDMQCWILPKENEKPCNFHYAPFASDVDSYAAYLSASDLFFLSSREDPFPSVVLDAFQLGLPVVALKDSGGLCPIIEKYGELVNGNDMDTIVTAIQTTVNDKDTDAIAKKQQARKQLIQDDFQYDDYCFDLLQHLRPDLKKISVILPNYNYEKYLAKRMWSIFNQTYPIYEIIILDDCSSDKSLKVVNQTLTKSNRIVKLDVNTANSGNVFRQWVKGINKAKGDYLWIAEADDEAENSLCANLSQRLNKKIAYAYVDSKQMNKKGTMIGESYKFYYDSIAKGDFDNNFIMDGKEYIEKYLSIKNLILNVSAVIWNKAILKDCLEETIDEVLAYSLTGDWHLYIEAALHGDVAYCADALNIHRRHDGSVTHSLDKKKHIEEVHEMHNKIKEKVTLDILTLEKMRNYEKELEKIL